MKLKRSAKIIIGFFVLVILWIVVAPSLAEFLIIEDYNQKPEAIWVLGGSKVYRIRCRRAAEMFDANATRKIFVIDDGGKSGWNREEQRNIPFAELSKRELVAAGIPEEKIEIVTPRGDGTNYEAELFAEINRQENFASLVLVTSDYHTRRSLWTFKRFLQPENLHISVGAAKVSDFEEKISTDFWWLSSKGREIIIGEYVKIIYYYLFLLNNAPK